MARKVILLAGLHKTGTTAVQKACASNLEILNRAGVYYPPEVTADFKFSHETGNHSRFMRGMFTERDALAPHLRPVLRTHLKNFILSSECETTLVVAESISSLLPDELRRLRDFFSEFADEISIYICVRKPIDWLNSMVGQQVIGRRGRKLDIRRSLLDFQKLNGIVRPRVENILTIFSGAKVYAFSDLKTFDLDPFELFMKASGVACALPEKVRARNIGASDLSVRVISGINATIKDLDARIRVHAFLNEVVPIVFRLPGPKFHLRNQEASPLLPLLLAENDWLRSTLGDGFYERDIEFSDDPVTLKEGERRFLADRFEDAPEPIRGAIMKFISEH